jgi:hypothetical protein
MRIGAILLTMLCWAGAAAAQGPPACAEDAQRFCADVQPGGGRIMQCLRQHAAELSSGCKDAMQRLGGPGGRKSMMRGNPWAKDCEADVAKFCQGVQPGGGRIMQCLQGHAGELSSACKTAIGNRPRRGAAPAAPAATVQPTPATQ